jgi:hypothetical protein
MGNWIRKIWNWIVKQLYKVPFDKWLHFIAGLIIGAFFCITLGMKAAIVPVIFAGFIKEFFDMWTTDKADWYDFLATVIGGLVIQLFVII